MKEFIESDSNIDELPIDREITSYAIDIANVKKSILKIASSQYFPISETFLIKNERLINILTQTMIGRMQLKEVSEKNIPRLMALFIMRLAKLPITFKKYGKKYEGGVTQLKIDYQQKFLPELRQILPKKDLIKLNLYDAGTYLKPIVNTYMEKQDNRIEIMNYWATIQNDIPRFSFTFNDNILIAMTSFWIIGKRFILKENQKNYRYLINLSNYSGL